MLLDGQLEGDIRPSRQQAEEDETQALEVDSAQERDERYLNYWMTTTTTVTELSYTVTSKMASIHCTPRLGWSYITCKGGV
jgi:hypothetical protein